MIQPKNLYQTGNKTGLTVLINKTRNLTMKSKLIIALLTILLGNSAYAYDPAARQEREPGPPSADAMIFDGLVLRPLSFVRTLVGTGVFIVTLPFSGENQEQAKQRLIDEPAAETFKRCLGCLVDHKH